MLFKIISIREDALHAYFTKKMADFPECMSNLRDSLSNPIFVNIKMSQLHKDNLEIVINWLLLLTKQKSLEFVMNYSANEFQKANFANNLISIIFSDTRIGPKDLKNEIIDNCNPLKLTFKKFFRVMYFSLGGDWRSD